MGIKPPRVPAHMLPTPAHSLRVLSVTSRSLAARASSSSCSRSSSSSLLADLYTCRLRACCCCCRQLVRLPPRRVERFQGRNVLKLEFWHMAVCTNNLRFAFCDGVYGVLLKENMLDFRTALCQNSTFCHLAAWTSIECLQSSVASLFPLFLQVGCFLRWTCCVCVVGGGGWGRHANAACL